MSVSGSAKGKNTDGYLIVVDHGLGNFDWKNPRCGSEKSGEKCRRSHELTNPKLIG